MKTSLDLGDSVRFVGPPYDGLTGDIIEIRRIDPTIIPTYYRYRVRLTPEYHSLQIIEAAEHHWQKI